MYVIRVTGDTAVPAIQRTANAPSPTIIPAERCVWDQSEPSGGGYDIDRIIFYDGVTANGIHLDTSVGISVELGYIGKTGRFVQITA